MNRIIRIPHILFGIRIIIRFMKRPGLSSGTISHELRSKRVSVGTKQLLLPAASSLLRSSLPQILVCLWNSRLSNSHRHVTGSLGCSISRTKNCANIVQSTPPATKLPMHQATSNCLDRYQWHILHTDFPDCLRQVCATASADVDATLPHSTE